MYFLVFSSKQVNCDKMIIIGRSIIKNYRNILGTIYLKLHMLRAAPLYSPIQWQWPLTLK